MAVCSLIRSKGIFYNCREVLIQHPKRESVRFKCGDGRIIIIEKDCFADDEIHHLISFPESERVYFHSEIEETAAKVYLYLMEIRLPQLYCESLLLRERMNMEEFDIVQRRFDSEILPMLDTIERLEDKCVGLLTSFPRLRSCSFYQHPFDVFHFVQKKLGIGE